MKKLTYALLFFVLLLGISVLGYLALSNTPTPDHVTYGVSFNVLYATELGLDWEQVYTAILDDLKVRHLRLAAHWPIVEPEPDTWNFTELDTEMRLAEEHGATVVLAVGRRLPRWPECHVPEWAKNETWDTQKQEILALIQVVVNRYKDSPALLYWQVENEPFLTVYAKEQCGDLDKDFLDEEIALVKKLDPDTPILVTDSGNLGLWQGAYRRGDVFGTSVYLYLWNEATGPFRSFLPARYYRFKAGLMGLLFGKKEVLLIELSAEPWLNKPITEASINTQLERMNPETFGEIVTFARDTHFSQQYLWGAEWWYWLKQQGDDRMWEKARELYAQ